MSCLSDIYKLIFQGKVLLYVWDNMAIKLNDRIIDYHRFIIKCRAIFLIFF